MRHINRLFLMPDVIAIANDNTRAEVAEAREYLSDGGLGEVTYAADVAFRSGFNAVTAEPALILALCMLAAEAIAARRK